MGRVIIQIRAYKSPPPHRPTSELSLEGESVDSGIGKGDSEEVGNVRAFCLVLDL